MPFKLTEKPLPSVQTNGHVRTLSERAKDLGLPENTSEEEVRRHEWSEEMEAKYDDRGE